MSLNQNTELKDGKVLRRPEGTAQAGDNSPNPRFNSITFLN